MTDYYEDYDFPNHAPFEPKIKFQRLSHGEGLPLPARATERAAGLDICSAVSLRLHPNARMAVATGFNIAVHHGYEVQVRSRSGLAAKHGVTVLNSPGTIDSDYRGEVMVILHNSGTMPLNINRGDRIAQLVIAPVVNLPIVEVEELDQTERGSGGMGSTGR